MDNVHRKERRPAHEEHTDYDSQCDRGLVLRHRAHRHTLSVAHSRQVLHRDCRAPGRPTVGGGGGPRHTEIIRGHTDAVVVQRDGLLQAAHMPARLHIKSGVDDQHDQAGKVERNDRTGHCVNRIDFQCAIFLIVQLLRLDQLVVAGDHGDVGGWAGAVDRDHGGVGEDGGLAAAV